MKTKLKNTLYSLSLFLFIIAFNFQHNPPSGWYQQFMPDIGGASIRDITFTDSLNGYIVTSIGGSNSYILKTINGGDNWSVKFSHTQPFVRIIFVDSTTGFTNAFTKIFKTTNSGENWTEINLPQIFGDDMFVLNEDTIWLSMSESLTGGVFRTTNGGASWQQQASFGSQNPSKIYMVNANTGFISNSSTSELRKTTDSGYNWFLISGATGFTDLKFIDENTGWKVRSGISKTTDGGLSWSAQMLPQLNWVNIALRLKVVNVDTFWAVGGVIQWIPATSNFRGVVYHTTNSGEIWGYQIPDTNLNYYQLTNIDFIDKLNGWTYLPREFGFHTVSGGDTTFFTSIEQVSNIVPEEFHLHQNYPNPFNPITKIGFDISKSEEVKIVVHDLLGREISVLVNERLSPGSYEYTFEAGSKLASGVYFYTLQTREASITKRMVFNK